MINFFKKIKDNYYLKKNIKYIKKLIKMDYDSLVEAEYTFRIYPNCLTNKECNKDNAIDYVLNESISILEDKLYLFKQYKKIFNENVKNNFSISEDKKENKND